MLAPVLPKIKDTEEPSDFYVAQSPDFEGYYPVNPPINKSLNGLITYFYDDMDGIGTHQMEANYQDGLLNGKVKIWRNTGELYCEGEYTSNKKSGKWTYFHTNGKVMEEGEYAAVADQSFARYDGMVAPFLSPLYFEYGVDTSTLQEIQSAGIIPLLNIGYNRSDARTGKWKFYNREGELTDEVSFT